MKKKKGKTRLASKLVLAVFSVSAAVMLIQMQVQINAETARQQQLALELEKRSQEVAQLESISSSELDDATVMRIAHEKLGLVLPGTRIFVDVSR